jgi:hypothetical protein
MMIKSTTFFIGIALIILVIFTKTSIEGFQGYAKKDEILDTKDTKGEKWDKFVKPNYYGIGTWGYHYGEPYYYRNVKE